MTRSLDMIVEELQGRPCSTEELDTLKLWARSRIHWSARVLHAIARSEGYLMQIEADSFARPRWFGIDFEELERGLRIASTA